MSSLSVHGMALLFYVAASTFYGANLALRSQDHLKRARAALILGVLLHTVAIGINCIETRQTPFASAFGTLSVSSWVVVLVYLPVELYARASALGSLCGPLASLLLFSGILRSTGRAVESTAVRSYVISSHVLVILVSFALFVLAACCAVFYLWQYNSLKHPDRKAIFRRLPALETVDSLAYHLIAFALPLLTIGLALGIVRAVSSGQSNWLADPHTLLSLLVWVVYAGYLTARLAAGWRGARLNYLLLAGLAIAMAIYFVPSGTHGFS